LPARQLTQTRVDALGVEPQALHPNVLPRCAGETEEVPTHGVEVTQHAAEHGQLLHSGEIDVRPRGTDDGRVGSPVDNEPGRQPARLIPAVSQSKARK
jgi:hypothetical protein